MANQRSWHEDEHKLTFIVCARADAANGAADAGAAASGSEGGCAGASLSRADEAESPPADLTVGMAGDVNAFLSEVIAEPINDDVEGQPTGELSAELEVMVADPLQRRRGLGAESLLLIIHFLLQHMPSVSEFVAKISDDNEPSLRLFQEKLGFRLRRHLAVFSQTELVLTAAEARGLAERAWHDYGARAFTTGPPEPEAAHMAGSGS